MRAYDSTLYMLICFVLVISSHIIPAHLTHWPLGKFNEILDMKVSNRF